MTSRPGDPAAGTVAARAAVTAATVTVAACPILAGLAVVSGAVAALVIPIVLATTALWMWRGGLAKPDHSATTSRVLGLAQPGHTQPGLGTDPPQSRVTAALPAITPGRASTPQLCVAWRRSYWLLHDLPQGPARCDVVAIREAILDELERRDPAGFQQWLQAGARAGSDPRRYLITGTDH